MINVISAVFRGAQSTTTRNAYQYDYGQVLKTNLALPETYEVQFSNNSSGGVAITQIGNADGVTIPDQMFISGAPIYAWIFLHQGADDGETVYFITIPVTKRAKPTSKQPTPVQKDAITQAIAALNSAVEQTGQDVEDANNAAESARESADAFEGMIAEEYDENKTYTIGDYSIHNDVLYRCITAITTAEAWTAAHWTAAALGDDVSGVKKDLSVMVNADYNVPVPLYTTVQIAISAILKWSSNGKSKFIPTSALGKTITVKGNSTNGSTISFLPSKTYSNGGNVTLADGTSRTFIPANTVQTFNIPKDCTYVNILDNWSGDYLPEYIKTERNMFPEIMTGDRIGLSFDEWTAKCAIFSVHTNSKAQGAEDTTSTADLMSSGPIPVYGKMLQLPLPWFAASTFGNVGMSLYDADFHPIEGRAITTYANRTDAFVVWQNVYLPENAKYFRTTYWSPAKQAECPDDIPSFTYNLLKEIPDEYKPITHELPVDTFMQNAIRRARQLTDIRWTPRVNIPRYSMMDGSSEHFLDWFYADHEYVGIPYSGAGGGESNWSTIKDWGYSHNWVGQHIPIESFVTAARYPNSIMGEKVNQSEPNYDSSPYGDVCTALVNYAVDGPTPLRGITNFFATSDNAFRTNTKTIANTDANDICIGDFLYTSEHVVIITDLLRDKDGNVTHIEEAEATTIGNGNNSVLGAKFGGVARRKMFTVADFKNRYGSYKRYRRVTFYGIPYTKSKYVNTGNEGDMELIVDMPCIPYLGEGAIYKVGYVHNSKICIGASGFTTLVVLKDGEEFGVFNVTGLTEISVGFSAEGSYEAYLSKAGDVRTRSCHWTVVV